LLEHVAVFEIDIVAVCTDSFTSVSWRVVTVHYKRARLTREYPTTVTAVVPSVEESKLLPTLAARRCLLIRNPVGFPAFLKPKRHTLHYYTGYTEVHIRVNAKSGLCRGVLLRYSS
jgi:hypothetical protein